MAQGYTLRGPRRELRFDEASKTFYESEEDILDALPKGVRQLIVEDKRSDRLVEMLRAAGFEVVQQPISRRPSPGI